MLYLPIYIQVTHPNFVFFVLFSRPDAQCNVETHDGDHGSKDDWVAAKVEES